MSNILKEMMITIKSGFITLLQTISFMFVAGICAIVIAGIPVYIFNNIASNGVNILNIVMSIIDFILICYIIGRLLK